MIVSRLPGFSLDEPEWTASLCLPFLIPLASSEGPCERSEITARGRGRGGGGGGEGEGTTQWLEQRKQKGVTRGSIVKVK